MKQRKKIYSQSERFSTMLSNQSRNRNYVFHVSYTGTKNLNSRPKLTFLFLVTFS